MRIPPSLSSLSGVPGTFLLLFLAFSMPSCPLGAQTAAQDTLSRLLDEVTITASPRENVALERQPLSFQELDSGALSRYNVTGLKSLTGLVPGLFIPSYGSRQTSAIYIRGVGSRINTPSVALYVDDVPLINKSTFDFRYADLERIEVLKGPQATLYGRNAMAGVIRVHTVSPFQTQGTRLRLTGATYGTVRAALSHSMKLSDRLAFLVSGFVDYQDGFFRNVARNGEKVDRTREQGIRLRTVWMASENTKVDLTASYEHLDQGAWPYLYTGALEGYTETREAMIGKVSYNDEGRYRRHLLNTGLQVQHTFVGAVLSSITSYQYLRDRMEMDQDYTEAPVFTLFQRQRSHVVAQEVVLRSRTSGRYDWVTGLSGSYSALKTNAPVDFKEEGAKTLVEDKANSVFQELKKQKPSMPGMLLEVHPGGFTVPGQFSTPTMTLSAYHQSTLNDFLVRGLSLTLGARLQYEKDWISYDTRGDLSFDFRIPQFENVPSMKPMLEGLRNLTASPSYQGKMNDDHLVLLPKAALNYTVSSRLSLFASLSKGYRSKGYNVQMFSDLVQEALSGTMMRLIDDKSGGMVSKMGVTVPEVDTSRKAVGDVVAYKPETSWNLEAGARAALMDGSLNLTASAFLMRITDLQISKFSQNGLGRIVVNAGRSRSWGLEAAARLDATRNLTFNASWGYTHATFRDYRVSDQVDYRGHFVPFVPRHTLMGGVTCRIPVRARLLTAVRVDGSVRAMGPIYWTEDNTARQDLYSVVDLRLTAEMGRHSLSLWVDNALNRDYSAFYFQSLGKGLRQKGNPLQVGLDLSLDF